MTIREWYNNHKDDITDLNFSYNICELKDYIANYKYFSSPKKLKSGNFTMLNDGNEGEVKFIMIIDAVKKQEESEQGKEDAVLNTSVEVKEND